MVMPGRAFPEPVGRSAVRARLRAFVDGSWPADPLLLVGEPGVGKTVLFEDAVARCTAAGRTVLRSAAAAPEAGMPYGSLNDLFAAVVDEPLLAALPELPRQAVEVVLLRRSADTEPAQLAVVTGIAMLLRELASRAPLLLAIDDVQWMDGESTLAIGYALRRIVDAPVALLGTARTLATALDPDPPRLPFGWANRLPVEGLEEPEFAELLRRHGVEDGAGERYVATGGNPGLALEVDEPGQLPPSVAGLVRARLEGFGAAAREVLTLVAACGRANTARIAAAFEDRFDDPRSAIDEANTELAVRERAGELVPAHPLLACGVLAELAPGARMRLHAKLAELVEEPGAKAHHLQRSVQPGPDEQTADALMAAARMARSRGEPEVAARTAEQALARAPEQLRAAVWMVDAAAMQFAVGSFNRVCELLSTMDFAVLTVPLLDRSLPLLIEATALTRGNRVAAELITELRAALEHDPTALAVLEGVGADPDYFPQRSLRMAERAVARLGRTELADAALHRALGELVKHGGANAERREQYERVYRRLADAGRSADVTTVGLAYCLRVGADPVRARTEFAERLANAQARGESYAAAQCLVQLAAAELLLGDYARAQRLLDEVDTGVFGDGVPPVLLVTRGRLLAGKGDFGALRSFLAEHSAVDRGDPYYREVYVRTLTGLAANRELRWADAVEPLTTAMGLVPRLGRLDNVVEVVLTTELAEAFAGTGELDKAQALAGRIKVAGIRARVRGMVHAARGDLEDAEHAMAESVAALRVSPLRPELARSLLELGRLRRRRRRRRSAKDTLHRARRLAEEVGEVPLARQAEAELARLASVPDAGALTAAERRVADLVVTGASNREVAGALFVSVRTVESHVQSVYRKLGVRSRTQLAARLQARA